MLTSPNQQAAAPAAAPETEQDPMAGDTVIDESQEQLQALDQHLNSLPPELQKQFEDGFRNYEDLPELFGMVMPEAYDYFKMVQKAVRQPQQGAPEQNPPAAGAPASPAGGQQQPLMAAANTPAKDTSAFAGMA